MKKIFLTAMALLAMQVHADNLKGFEYGTSAAPDGSEWQSPERLSLNKEQPRAYMFQFATVDQAKGVLPQQSPYYQSLDGTWKFQWVAQPDQRDSTFQLADYNTDAWDDIEVPGCWNVQGLQKDGTMRYGVPAYVNQPVMFYHEVVEGDWKKGVMRTPPSQWTTYQYRNEVGQYRRTFSVPKDWKGRRVYINFDGVDSFFFLWINGHYVGFSKNSRNTARFDITPYLNKKGENSVSVEVYRHSDGSFLEAQDMFRLPGIYRSTYLTSSPELQIQDLAIRTSQLRTDEAVVTVDAVVSNLGKDQKYSLEYQIFPVELYADATGDEVASRQTSLDHDSLVVPSPRLWSAEEPNRYVLVAQLKNQKGKTVDIVSSYFGIRTVEIRDTEAKDDEFGLAGRYFYINNKPVKLKGVNRHENNPSTGHAITHEQMEREIMLMKQGNINHIRLSHYSNDPYLYYLTDKYGLYLEDEANIESHEYYYGAASLSHPKEWEAAHVARNMEMVRSHVNAPSIVIWSLGNEAGPGDNFKAAYRAIKSYDKSRPVQYERNNDIVDMGSNQYPSIAWVQSVATGKSGVKYPFHISEYAHSMGNSLGNFVDYWNAMESTNYFCGGAIWDWVDQAIDAYTPEGVKYFGYGGDHGDWPNDGMFCMNGIMLPDLQPKPQYYEVKKVYQNVGATFDWDTQQLEVLNKNYFLPLSTDVEYVLRQEGSEISRGTLNQLKGLATRQRMTVSVPVSLPQDGDNFTLEIDFKLEKDMPWAKKGYVQMAEQFEYRKNAETPYQPLSQITMQGSKLTLQQTDELTTVKGESFEVAFDNRQGSILSLCYAGANVFQKGEGPKLDAFRAPVDNDNWAWNAWFQNGLYKLQHRVIGTPNATTLTDGTVKLTYKVWSQAATAGQGIQRPGKAGQPWQEVADGRELTADDFHFESTIEYFVYPDGSVALCSSIVTSDPSVSLPRLGYAMKLPSTYDQLAYYGRGPLNNYADRKTGSFQGLYESTVKEQFVNFPKPQSMGNREEVSWAALTNTSGTGAAFIADYNQRMCISALPWSALQMTLAQHPHELPESDGIYLHLDCQVNGLGGNSCGQGGPLEQDRVKGSVHQMSFVIRPLNKHIDRAEQVRVASSLRHPLAIVRDRAGKVTLVGDEKAGNNNIMYTMQTSDSKRSTKPALYDGEPINFAKGGSIEAWYADGANEAKATATFSKVDFVPLEISFVSSEEGPEGGWAANLVDNDPNTIWHSMYSITMGSHPYWIEFDCNEVKQIKGFTWLPRQEGSNGDVKDYEIRLSLDGKTWTEPVAKGSFPRSKNKQTITLEKAQRARYVRFTALSSQSGDNFGSGAEFGVLAE